MSCGGRAATLLLVAVTLSATLVPTKAAAWGLTTHRWIALRAATLTRCRPLVGTDARVLADLAVEPDTVLKARLGKVEEVRHFLDLDAYGAPPFAALPRDESAAVARFGRDAVDRDGVLPWWGGRLARRLAEEIAQQRWSAARLTAGHLAHYAGDATMPLHATVNYDGQRTDQRGLHGRIERQLVDEHLAAFTGRADGARRRPIAPEQTEAALFDALAASFDAVPALLAADRGARRGTHAGSALYYRRLDADLRPLLRARLADAAALTAAVWDGACAPR